MGYFIRIKYSFFRLTRYPPNTAGAMRKQTATARALISDAATQEDNVEVRKQTATARALMSDTATQEDNVEVRKQTATARALMSDTATQEDNAPLRVLWMPCHVSVIPAFLLIITAGNNYVSHTCHISNYVVII